MLIKDLKILEYSNSFIRWLSGLCLPLLFLSALCDDRTIQACSLILSSVSLRLRFILRFLPHWCHEFFLDRLLFVKRHVSNAFSLLFLINLISFLSRQLRSVDVDFLQRHFVLLLLHYLGVVNGDRFFYFRGLIWVFL
jgi:hypothetical protein